MVAGLCSSNHCPPTVVLQWTEFIIIIIIPHQFIIIPSPWCADWQLTPSKLAVQASLALPCEILCGSQDEMRESHFVFVFVNLILCICVSFNICPAMWNLVRVKVKWESQILINFFHWGSYQRGPSPILISVRRQKFRIHQKWESSQTIIETMGQIHLFFSVAFLSLWNLVGVWESRWDDLPNRPKKVPAGSRPSGPLVGPW